MKQVKKADPMRTLLSFSVLVFVIALISCDESRLVDEDVLAKSYVDLLIAEDHYENNTDSLAIRQNEIYEKYGIDKESYLYSFDKISKDPENWKSFNQLAQSYIDSLKSEAGIR